MIVRLLDAAVVEEIHAVVLNPGELQGMAGNRSLDGALARVDNRLVYGMIEDAIDLASAYAVAIATEHVFNDGNKRTAYKSMVVSLYLNGIRIVHATTEAGDVIREVAQRGMDEEDLSKWLCKKAVD